MSLRSDDRATVDAAAVQVPSVRVDHRVPAMRAALAGKSGWRAFVFHDLQRARALTIADKLRALEDPSLRVSAEPLLEEHAREIEPQLRALLDGASDGTRAAFVRLLRTIDERVGSDGTIGETNGHYPEHALASTLRVNLESGKLELVLRFPFEDFADPRFVAVYANIADTLGRIALTPTGFSIATPTGKKLKLKKQRFAG